ncbi:MAG: SRPBCC domain-containing protein [Caulobacterales bacterium]|nr:SRPBCC domain-containing protein [Caulobacterales bacterium]
MADALHDTFTVERRYPQPRARVFAAFAEPTKKRRWYAEGGGHELDVFEMDFRVGGTQRSVYRMGASTPFPGAPLASEGAFHDIVDGRRIVEAAHMSLDGAPMSVSLLTFEFHDDGDGTRLVCVHQGVFFENADGPKMRRGGWEVLFERLAQALNG